MEFVQLVDEQDRPLGVMDKMTAHRQGRLHRALSVFVFNSKGELLLQRRAKNKYHSNLLWTNTCCSHPRPEEDCLDAANRRLFEEMGMHCALKHQFSFVYRAVLDNDMIENEFDYVFFGTSDDKPHINLEEVDTWQYLSLEATFELIQKTPELFTEWFKIIFDKVKELRKCTSSQT